MKNLPEDAYKGQQQRLKENLIKKAKLKKSYAKVLQQEEKAGNLTPAAKEAEPEVEKKTNNSNDNDLDEAEDHSRDQVIPETIDTIPKKSYRQRDRERKKADPTASKAHQIRAERDQERELLAAKKAAIEKKRGDRNDIRKREMSRTKKGQPLIKDRMKNILDKLQSS